MLFKRKVTAAVNKIGYKDALTATIIRLCRALDATDFESAFLRIWNIIEQLTNTVGDRYDETIKRACFLFEERDYHKRILEHLRRQRNSSVHHSEFAEQAENTLFQVKFYAQHLLAFHVFNPYKFQTMQEGADFLATTTDERALRDRLKKSRFALRFLGYNGRN